MQLNIEIDDKLLKDLIEKEISNIDREKIAELALEALKTYLNKEDTLNDIVFDKRNNAWDARQMNRQFYQLIEKSWQPDAIKEIQNEICDCVRKNNKELIEKTMAGVLSSMLFSPDSKDQFKYELINLMRSFS